MTMLLHFGSIPAKAEQAPVETVRYDSHTTITDTEQIG